GAWVDDPVLNPYSITEGRAPTASGEVVIDARSAADGDLAVGDVATVLTPAPTEVTIVGLVGFGEQTSMIGATYVGFAPAQAAAVLGHDGTVSALLVRGDGSVSDEALRDAIAAELGDGAEAITGAELTDEQRAAIEGDFLGFVKIFLVAFAGIALVVATFSIHNTFTILVAQRTRESALLRAIGASRRQVLGSVALESVLVGTVASVVGLVAGIGVARGLVALLAGAGLDLGGTSLQITASTLGLAAAVGIVTTVVASAVPALRAARIAPIEALRDAAAEDDRTSWLRVALGTTGAVAGIALVATATSTPDGALARAGLGMLALVAGTVVLGPVIARPTAALLGAPIAAARGPVGRLARRNAMRNPRRTAGSALALVIGTTVVALFATFGASIERSIDQTVERSFGGDLVVSQDTFSQTKLSPDVGPAIAALDEVDATVVLSDVTVTVDGAAQYPTAADPADLDGLVDLDVQDGSVADLAAGKVAISTRFAEDHDLALGDPLEVAYLDGSRQTLAVGATYAVADLLGELVITPADAQAHTDRLEAVAVLVGLADGVDLEAGRTAVEEVAAANGGPTVQDRDEYVEAIAGEIDSLLTLIYGLLGLAIVIALMGLANTLALSIHERTREIGLLRAVGLSR
ncbi:MAG: FtsX-like permease family protein, partial [Acidimicrobiales bacterium]|nr:FtsX-like permease family protein [Acidimicrobiales bacterium]